MNIAAHRPIDCDVHITVPSMQPLLPYMDDYWRDHMTNRGTDKLNLTLTTQPLGAPIMGRADWRTPGKAPGSDLASLQRDALDAFGSRMAIAHCVHTGQVFYSEDMAAAVCRALNDYIAREWLDREPRLRAAIVVPAQSPDLAVQEIERRATDHRFVEVQLLVDERDAARPALITGRSTNRHSGTTCRSACTPAAAFVVRRRRLAGRPTSSRTMSATPRCSRACFSASSPRACSRSFPSSKW